MYNINGQFEFEFKNGYGKVKEYNDNNKLTFEGKYINI